MARENPAPKFRIIPAASNYPGLTAIPTTESKEIVAMGVGREVEDMLVARVAVGAATKPRSAE